MMSSDELEVGDIFLDCAYHPVTVTEIDEDSIRGISLVDGSRPRECSIRHCPHKKLTREDADELLAIWKTEGERAVLICMGWKPEHADTFISEWREQPGRAYKRL